jgi:hypothetical protein
MNKVAFALYRLVLSVVWRSKHTFMQILVARTQGYGGPIVWML